MAGINEEIVDLEQSVNDLNVSAIQRCGRDTVFTSPKCLIKASYGRMTVNQETLRQIATVTRPLVVIAIVGPYRTGKSYLLTRLAGKYSGFPLGNAIQPKTKGIWAWCVEHPVNADQQLLLLDTEGLGDIEMADEYHDIMIFTMATLLSSTLIYNAKGTFDQDALQKLSSVVNFAKNVKVIDDKSDSKGRQVDFYLPDFVLVLRDFYLVMQLEGKEITPDNYLENCLRVKSGSAENEPRLRLRKFFKNRKCFTMAQPGVQRVLKQLECLTDKDLDPDFVKDLQKFLNYVYNEAKPLRTRNETSINGSKTYADALDKGGIPCIDNAFKMMAAKANEEAIAKIFDYYKQTMLDIQLPTNDELDLVNAHRAAKKVADENYLKLAVMDDDLKFKHKLSRDIQDYFTQLREVNQKLSSDKCIAKLKELHDPISEKVKSGEYSCKGGYEAYQRDLNDAKEKYYGSESIGFMKDSIFVKFREDRDDEKKEVILADIQLKEVEKQLKLAEEEIKIATEKERLRKVEEEKMEKEKRKDAELKVLEMEKLVEKMQQDREKERQKAEELLKKKEEECNRLEEEGLCKEAALERKQEEFMRQYLDGLLISVRNWVFQKTLGWLF